MVIGLEGRPLTRDEERRVAAQTTERQLGSRSLGTARRYTILKSHGGIYGPIRIRNAQRYFGSSFSSFYPLNQNLRRRIAPHIAKLPELLRRSE